MEKQGKAMSGRRGTVRTGIAMHGTAGEDGRSDALRGLGRQAKQQKKGQEWNRKSQQN